MTVRNIKNELLKYAQKERVGLSERFFKTGKGEYAQDDIFIGVRTPDIRVVANIFKDVDLDELVFFLNSKIHEERFLALEILVIKYEKGDVNQQTEVVDFYLKHKDRINNWDLVDTSASYILGNYLFDKDRKILYILAKSKNLWDRRIAIVSTHYFIKNNDFKDILELTLILINDKEDLIHKALGWMLREVGKKNEKVLVNFLNLYSKKLPRTTLRYSIERLSGVQKRKYMER